MVFFAHFVTIIFWFKEGSSGSGQAKINAWQQSVEPLAAYSETLETVLECCTHAGLICG